MAQGSSNPTTDIRKIAGVAIATGAGVTDTGTQRVVLSTNQSSIPVTDGGGQITVDGTVAATQSGTWNIGSITTLPTLQNVTTVGTVSTITTANLAADDVHDGVAGTTVVMTGGFASSAAPTAVAAGDASRIWTTLNGAVNIADGGGNISIDDGGGQITVDGTVGISGTVPVSGTFWQATQPVSIVSVPQHPVTNAGTFPVQVSSALPAGTNNIGDVDILQVVPGTGTTNLGKQTDSPAGATDTGIAVLAIRDDALTALTPADGDYTRFRVNNTGRLWTSAAIDSALPAGSNTIGTVNVGTIPTVSVNTHAVTQSGTWNIGSVTQITNSVAVTGPLTDTQLRATAVPVSGTVNVGTMPTVSITQNSAVNVAQLAGVSTATGAGTSSTGTLRTVEAGAATATQTNPSMSTTSSTVLAASTSRRGASIFNGSSSILYLRLSSSSATSSLYTVKMYPEDYYEVPSFYNGAITGILDAGTSTLVQVTQIT